MTEERSGMSHLRLAVSAVLTLGALAVLIGLGTWQLQRLWWKEDLIARVEARVTAPPEALPPAAAWPTLTSDGIEFRRVAFEATYLHDREVHVYIALTQPRGPIGGQGYFVVTPARLADGRIVFVNRGFVPLDRKDPATRAEGQVAGERTIVGLMRPPEPSSWITPAPDIARNVWFTRDPKEMAEASALDPATVAPFTVDAEAGEAPGGLPQGGETVLSFPNSHLSYVITWYGLALALVAVVGSVLLRRRKAPR
ncbi:SURF1 family protein [Methylobrevis pamukkalensis]|uniref:SURF1-like protein n=1 Tax=Methylobrevis pamukkalensis TaxID=1439726 RepID=A0A1E3H785_9HYPH|nr:SURF1 family protein [Methylobrevis pamukkalensis]ODN71636.1 SURF1 family protein [Methylobrevis pamukkalensis]